MFKKQYIPFGPKKTIKMEQEPIQGKQKWLKKQKIEEEPIKIETNDVETTTRKPKGHRPKKESKDDLLQKVNCEKCDKVISLHNKKYTHKKFCKKEVAEEPKPEQQSVEPVQQQSIEPVQQQQPIKQLLPISSRHIQPSISVTRPLNIREKMLQQKISNASRLIAQAF